jgi:hypothetical protein
MRDQMSALYSALRTARATGKVFASFSACLIVALMPASTFGKDHLPPNRSVYLPIAVLQCKHLEANAKYYENEQLVGTTPIARTMQFTYYPALKRVLPEVVQIRIEGVYVDTGEPFVGRFALTPNGVYTAHTRQPLDLIKELAKSHHKIDVHLKPLVLHIACDRLCPREKEKASGAPPSEEHEDSQKESETNEGP